MRILWKNFHPEGSLAGECKVTDIHIIFNGIPKYVGTFFNTLITLTKKKFDFNQKKYSIRLMLEFSAQSFKGTSTVIN